MEFSKEELEQYFEYHTGKPDVLLNKKTGHEFTNIKEKDRIRFRSTRVYISAVIWQLYYGDLAKDDYIKLRDKSKNVSLDNLTRYTAKEVNEVISAKKNMEWGKLFYYENGNLYWKVENLSLHNRGLRVNNKVGDPVRYHTNNEGYAMISIKTKGGKRSHSYHRVLWEVVNGKIEDNLTIDHINGNRADNRIENLRLVPKTVNARNVKLLVNNTSGVAGVHFSTDNYWVARYNDINGVRRTKKFSVKKLGNKGAFDAAVAYRKAKIEELNRYYGEDGYTERHGTPLEEEQ